MIFLIHEKGESVIDDNIFVVAHHLSEDEVLNKAMAILASIHPGVSERPRKTFFQNKAERKLVFPWMKLGLHIGEERENVVVKLILFFKDLSFWKDSLLPQMDARLQDPNFFLPGENQVDNLGGEGFFEVKVNHSVELLTCGIGRLFSPQLYFPELCSGKKGPVHC